jgi:hypothetical protein
VITKIELFYFKGIQETMLKMQNDLNESTKAAAAINYSPCR